MKIILVVTVGFTLTIGVSAVASDLNDFLVIPTPPGGTPIAAVDEYTIDDGTGEASAGLAEDGTLFWLNEFTVVAGFEVITAVRIAWGSGPGGNPGEALVFDDPNNDGIPTDVTPADLLASAPLVSGAGPTNTFSTYPITKVSPGAAGDRFFVGVCVSHLFGQGPAYLDQTDPDNGRSWLAGDASSSFPCDDPNGATLLPLSNIDTLGLPGDWMVRANATVVTPVMEASWGRIKATYAD